MSIMVEIDNDSFCRAMVKDMKDSLADFEEALTEEEPNIFVCGDPEVDKVQIQAHIDAFKLVIDWYQP